MELVTQLNKVFLQINEPILSIELDGTIVFNNPKAENIDQYTQVRTSNSKQSLLAF